MKNWMFLLFILGSGLSFSFELPAESHSDLYDSLSEEGAFFEVQVTHRSQDGKEEGIYAFTFKEKEEFLEKFSEMKDTFSQDLLFESTALNRNYRQQRQSTGYEFPVMRGWGDVADADVEPKTEEARPFFDLPLTNDDKKNIRKLITTLADKNILQLLLDKKGMEKLGDKIRPVHPLKFASFILKDPYLKKCLRTIEKDSLKWGPFVDGFEEKMKTETKAGKILVYIPGFLELLDADPKQVQKLLQNKNYSGFLTDL